MNDTYLTISAPAEGLFKDKGSKFIAYAYPIKTENALKQHIQTLKKEHFNARHHCYAFMLGAEKQQYRANDDGEPSGTAGKPILGQIQSNNLTNIGIVVVRYFGGTLLGTSGLINAYREAAADALANAAIVEEIVTLQYNIAFPYEQMNTVMKIVKDLDMKVLSQGFDTVSTITVEIRKSNIDEALTKFEKLGIQVNSH